MVLENNFLRHTILFHFILVIYPLQRGKVFNHLINLPISMLFTMFGYIWRGGSSENVKIDKIVQINGRQTAGDQNSSPWLK